VGYVFEFLRIPVFVPQLGSRIIRLPLYQKSRPFSMLYNKAILSSKSIGWRFGHPHILAQKTTGCSIVATSKHET
jgi:hypothetical protein